MNSENTRGHKMKIIFSAHPNADVFYVTSDDQAFFQSHDAKLHAAELDDTKVDEVSRESIQEKKIDLKTEISGSKAAEDAVNAGAEKASLIPRYEAAFGTVPEEGITAAKMEAEIATKEADLQKQQDATADAIKNASTAAPEVKAPSKKAGKKK